jgi:hypothetical protein
MNYSSRNLSIAEWNNLSINEREAALNDLEKFLANQDGRDPASVEINYGLAADNYGLFYSMNNQDIIAINSSLVRQSTPYRAVETLFHEDRHAFQQFMVDIPQAEIPGDVIEDWKMNISDGYIKGDEINSNYAEYRWQPIEKDAFQMARQKTDELFKDCYNDTEGYPKYKDSQEQNLNNDRVYGELLLGENYEDEARQKMIEQYQDQQPYLTQSTHFDNLPISLNISADDKHKVDYNIAEVIENFTEGTAEFDHDANEVNHSAQNGSEICSSESTSVAEDSIPSGNSEGENDGYGYGYGL